MGDGFVAGVRMSGRAILEEEDGEAWISGVAPAGLTDGGPDKNAAFANFQNAWTAVIFDIAAEAGSFAEFYEECQAFLESRAEHLTEEWEAALRRVREEGYKDETLRSEPAEEQTVGFVIEEIVPSKAKPDQNQISCGLRGAA